MRPYTTYVVFLNKHLDVNFYNDTLRRVCTGYASRLAEKIKCWRSFPTWTSKRWLPRQPFSCRFANFLDVHRDTGQNNTETDFRRFNTTVRTRLRLSTLRERHRVNRVHELPDVDVLRHVHGGAFSDAPHQERRQTTVQGKIYGFLFWRTCTSNRPRPEDLIWRRNGDRYETSFDPSKKRTSSCWSW